MELQFLGTSAGTPTKSRNVSGLAVKKAQSKLWVLVDCGEATQHRLLHTALSLHHLQAICITHVHGDHCYGLPGLLASASLQGRTATLIIIGPRELQEWLSVTMQLTQVTLSYALDYIDVATLTESVPLQDMSVSAWPLSHRVPCFGFQFTEADSPYRLNKEKLLAEGIPSGPTWGQLQRGETAILRDGRRLDSADYLLANRPARKVVVAGDNDLPALLREAVRSAQVLVHEATYTQDIADKIGVAQALADSVSNQPNVDPQHSSAKLIAEFAHAVALPNLILTHFSPRYSGGAKGRSMNELEQEALSYYSGTLFLARDLARYYLDTSGVLRKVPMDNTKPNRL